VSDASVTPAGHAEMTPQTVHESLLRQAYHKSTHGHEMPVPSVVRETMAF